MSATFYGSEEANNGTLFLFVSVQTPDLSFISGEVLLIKV